MEPRPKLSRSAILAATIVAIGIFGLFLRLQEYGPESALRKFHQAIQRGSWSDLQRVTVEDVRSGLVRRAVQRAGALMAIGGNRSPRILRTDRLPNQVRLVVAYASPGRQPTYLVWVVDRKGQTWKVNTEATDLVSQ